MASQYFTYTPVSGHGDTVVSAQVLTTNSGQTSKDATIWFDDGTGPWYLKVSQYYKPYYVMPVAVFPVSGGTLDFTVNSKYDYYFHEIPNWADLRIKKGNRPVSADTKIFAQENVLYTLTASANTTSQPRTTVRTFALNYYDLKGASANTASYIMVRQPASGTTAWEDIPATLTFNATTNRDFMITLNLDSLEEQPMGYVITVSAGHTSWAGTLEALVSTVSAETPLTLKVNVAKGRFDAFDYENDIALDYGTDSLYETGPIGTDYVFNTVFHPGEGMVIDMDVRDI